jgi:hypothetical protein
VAILGPIFGPFDHSSTYAQSFFQVHNKLSYKWITGIPTCSLAWMPPVTSCAAVSVLALRSVCNLPAHAGEHTLSARK